MFQLTYADIFFASLLDFIVQLAPDSTKEFPTIIADFKDGIMELPAIKAWVEKRPVTHL